MSDTDAGGDTETPPDGWSKRDQDPQIVDKYDPRQPSLYEHDDGQVVQVVPDAGNRAGSDQERWRVDAVDGDPAAPEGTTILAEREGRSDALAFARETMAAYDGRGDVTDAARTVEDGT
jgi:hypothetical protein